MTDSITYYSIIFCVLCAIVNINFANGETSPIESTTQKSPAQHNPLKNSTTIHRKHVIGGHDIRKRPTNQTLKALSNRSRRQYDEFGRHPPSGGQYTNSKLDNTLHQTPESYQNQQRFLSSQAVHNNANLFQNIPQSQTFTPQSNNVNPQSNNVNQFFQRGQFNSNQLPSWQGDPNLNSNQLLQRPTTSNNFNQGQRGTFNPSQLPTRPTESFNPNQLPQRQTSSSNNGNALIQGQFEQRKNILDRESSHSPPGRLSNQQQNNNQTQNKPNQPSHSYYYPPRMPLPLPSCFHNPTGYACCNPILNDLMVETYTELEARPKFHTCNINAIASMLQTRAEQRFNTSFETIAGFEDFAQKVHFNGDLVCKIELGGKYMLAYGTARNAAATLEKNENDIFSLNDVGSNTLGATATVGTSNSNALVKSARRQKRSIGPLNEEEVRLPLNHISRRYSMWI